MARIRLMVSMTSVTAERLGRAGPRRDVLELARSVKGEVVFQEQDGQRKGLRHRLLGPHMHQAWQTAGQTEAGDVVFADGEHNGIPVLFALAIKRKRPARVVMIGHLVSRPWKRALLRIATRLGVPGTLVLHSVSQRDAIIGTLGRRWRSCLLPYQVDTAYWAAAIEGHEDATPFIIAVGAENRDYAPLVDAVRGLGIRLVIVAGSYWARETASSDSLPPNVEYRREPIPYDELRSLYGRATAAVVPLHNAPNQSGVTTILEAMSCGLPVIVSASRGQQECVTGPLVHGDGSLDVRATETRGPGLFDRLVERTGVTGLYVPVGDVPALRAAISRVLDDRISTRTMGRTAATVARRHFTVEGYVESFAAVLRGSNAAAQDDSANPRRGTSPFAIQETPR